MPKVAKKPAVMFLLRTCSGSPAALRFSRGVAMLAAAMLSNDVLRCL